jgi:hypothetical protein
LRSISYRKSGGTSLLEASNAVNTSMFSTITGQIVFSAVLERYADPEFLWPDLVTTINTNFLDGEVVPGIGRIGDKAEVVDEGGTYPTVGLNEAYVRTQRTQKRGLIVPLTREVITADRTGILLREAGEVGHWMGINKEKRVLDVVTGQVNNYNRNAVSTNSYLTSGAYINAQTGNALDGSGNEWRAIEKSELLFDGLTDPNTGEPIIGKIDALIVPSALKRTALRILGATDVQTVDMRANAVTIRTTSQNPYRGDSLKVLSSPYVKSRSGSSSLWWCGQPKRAFSYFQIYDIETLQAASNSEPEFTQDIWMRFKVSERGVCQVLEPRVMVQNNT